MNEKKQLNLLSRIISALCGFGLIAVLFLPIWRIELDAPQYPEGLALQIYASEIAGDVEIINGLNHYIGMKTLHSKDFIEFTVLPYLISFFAAFCLLVAIMNRSWLLKILFFSFVVFCVVAMVDFWRWEYNYGHDLDPNAAIQVPGMAYQPPLIGFKQLLNFGAFSVPDTGGWIFIVVGILLLSLFIMEWKKGRKVRLSATSVSAAVMMLLFSACSSGPDQIRLGKDHCGHCAMTITEPEFAAELITTKGKVYKFDDLTCMADFVRKEKVSRDEIAQLLVSDFNNSTTWLETGKCFFMKSPDLRSPMGGNIAAFATEDERNSAMVLNSGTSVTWTEIMEQ